jgi:hypothetical protein
MFETILDWILIGLEIVIGGFLLIILFMPKADLDEVLKVDGDSHVN